MEITFELAPNPKVEMVEMVEITSELVPNPHCGNGGIGGKGGNGGNHF